MEDKSNLYVFDKKEVALIFLFMILIAVTSFIFGVKIGKNYSYSISGLTTEDRERVDMLSTEEEQVKANLSAEQSAPKTEHTEALKATEDQTYKKLQEEFNKLEEDGKAIDVKDVKSEEAPVLEAPKAEQKKEMTQAEAIADVNEFSKSASKSANKDKYTGKYTIQLGSHRSIKEAEDFANGFKIRGYNPIINEVEISGKGTWYRVSLGSFNSVSDAKDYIIKEKSLFQGQDYVIGKFD